MPDARRFVLLLAALLLPLLVAGRATAQPTDADVAEAARVLQQATYPAANNQHHAVLRGLRRTHDPQLRPLYAWLSGNDHADLQTHGLLGLAETDPERALDLARLAEITDARQRIEIIGAALDDDLLKPMQMSTLLGWNDLDQGVRQALAIRLIAKGGVVDPSLFNAALTGDAATDPPGELLERGVAGVALAQLGDHRGLATLRSIDALPASPQTNAVRAQLLSLASRHDLRAVGPWVSALAKAPATDQRLREAALRTALILKSDNAQSLWLDVYRAQTELAPRLRLALVAVSAAPHFDPAMLTGLDTGGAETLELLLRAGAAAAGDPPINLQPIETLIQAGYVPGSRWLVVYARDEADAQAPAILERIILGYDRGHPTVRNELTAIAIEAAATLADLETPASTQTLSRLIRDARDPMVRQILYTGLVRCDAQDLDDMIAALPEPADKVSQDTYLVLRLRHGLDLSAQQWQRVATLVSLPGQTDPGVRAELAWHCVKRAGRDKAVLDQITRQAGR